MAYDNPDYKIRRMGESEPDLFTQWYEKYVKGKPGLGTTKSLPQPSMAKPGALMTPAAMTPPAATATAPPPGIPPVAPVGGTPAAAPTWSENVEAGLREPAKVGALATGLSMLATPNTRFEQSTGQILGRAGLTGLSVFQSAVQSKRRDELAAAQTAHYATADEKTRMEIDKLKRGGGLITEAMAKTLNLPPESIGTDIEGWKDLSSYAKGKDKVFTPDNKLVSIDGGPKTVRNVNSPEMQELIAAGKVKFPEEGEKGKGFTPKYEEVRLAGETEWVRRDVNSPEMQKAIAENDVEFRKEPKDKDLKQYQFEWDKAKESLAGSGVTNPTEYDISQERQALFPRSIVDTLDTEILERLFPGAGTAKEKKEDSRLRRTGESKQLGADTYLEYSDGTKTKWRKQ